MIQSGEAHESPILTTITYKDGETVSLHCHAPAQVIYAVSGIMEVIVNGKQWRVPPQRAIWIPPQIAHSMRAQTAVELRTVYVPAAAVLPRFTEKPLLIAVSPLLRELILRGIEIHTSTDAGNLRQRIMSLAVEELALLLEESAHAPERSLPLPSGRDKRLARICEAILADPGHSLGLAEWTEQVGASKRTLSRLFQSEFGMSFVNWRQQVRIVTALSRLDQGDPVSIIAGDLGYETPSAFSLMFRRLTGVPPSQYVMTTSAHQTQQSSSSR